MCFYLNFIVHRLKLDLYKFFLFLFLNQTIKDTSEQEKWKSLHVKSLSLLILRCFCAMSSSSSKSLLLLIRQLFCLFANKPDDFTYSLMLLCAGRTQMTTAMMWQEITMWCTFRVIVHSREFFRMNNFRIYWTCSHVKRTI